MDVPQGDIIDVRSQPVEGGVRERTGIVVEDALQTGVQHQDGEQRAGRDVALVQAVQSGGQVADHPRRCSPIVGLPVHAHPFDVNIGAAMAGIVIGAQCEGCVAILAREHAQQVQLSQAVQPGEAFGEKGTLMVALDGEHRNVALFKHAQKASRLHKGAGLHGAFMKEVACQQHKVDPGIDGGLYQVAEGARKVILALLAAVLPVAQVDVRGVQESNGHDVSSRDT